jgi:hypothetical protein
VLGHFGIETGEHSFAYVAGWTAGERELLASVLNAIARDAREIIGAVEACGGRDAAEGADEALAPAA